MRSVLHENSEYLPVRPLLEAIRPEFLSPEVGVLVKELGEGSLLAQILCRQLVSIPIVEENDSLILDEWRAELQGVFGGQIHNPSCSLQGS
jgi:hypothetical protein